MRRIFGVVFKISLMALAALVVACSSGSKKKFAYVERPVEQLYQDAANRLERKRYDEAVALFEEVERQHPYSSWARRAMLMKAFARYRTNEYDEAVAALDQFITLHPGNKDAPYAYYLKAMCFYEQITDVGRDQDNTQNAVTALNDLARRYPNSEYARDARLKLDLTYDHLAGRELNIGRFYMKSNKHISAINRFKYVIANYSTTGHAEEALHRLAEAYLELGLVEEARASAAVLGANYPGSRWYEDSYRLFARRGLIDKDGLALAPKKKAPKTAKAGNKDDKKAEGEAAKLRAVHELKSATDAGPDVDGAPQ